MKRAIVIVVTFLLLATGACFCSGCKGEAPDSGGSGFTREDESITVGAGEEFDITLESNPSTGYMWKVTGRPDPSVAELTGSEYVPPEKQAPGAPGRQVFELKGMAPGQTSFKAMYSRSWEGEDPDAETVEFEITVK